MPNGNMESYLKNSNDHHLSVGDILNFCVASASGIEHLHKRQIIHRDIAARNCLLDEYYNLKISDYGLAQEGAIYDYYSIVSEIEPKNEEKLPITRIFKDTPGF